MKQITFTKKIAASLSAILFLTSAGIAASGTFPNMAASAAAKSSSSFLLFEQRVKQPSSLSLAQGTLVNRIDEMTPGEANIAVLHLENALKAYLPTAAKRMNTPAIQKDIKSIYTKGMPMVLARSKVKQLQTSIVLQDLSAMDYRLAYGGGSFYPVIQYRSFKVFKPYLTKDLQAYFELMAAGSEQPSAVDGTLLIDWYKVAERALEYEAFLQTYQTSNRAAAVKEAFGVAKKYVFYGSPKTPLFDNKTQVMSEKAAIAYENTLSEAGPEQIEASTLLTQLDDFLVLLEKNGDTKTQAVSDYLKSLEVPGIP